MSDCFQKELDKRYEKGDEITQVKEIYDNFLQFFKAKIECIRTSDLNIIIPCFKHIEDFMNKRDIITSDDMTAVIYYFGKLAIKKIRIEERLAKI
jgi:hypothetical protein